MPKSSWVQMSSPWLTLYRSSTVSSGGEQRRFCLTSPSVPTGVGGELVVGPGVVAAGDEEGVELQQGHFSSLPSAPPPHLQGSHQVRHLAHPGRLDLDTVDLGRPGRHLLAERRWPP